jgi:hypothetical protein
MFTLDIYSWLLNAWLLGNSCVAYWQFSCLPAGGQSTTTKRLKSQSRMSGTTARDHHGKFENQLQEYMREAERVEQKSVRKYL